MLKEHTKEELWKLYEKLPEELKETVFSVETADNIWNICERNNINDVSEVAKLVGNVLLGILTPDEFSEALEKELKLKNETAKKASQEINRFIFYPVKPALEELYKIGGEAPAEEKEKIKPELKEPSYAVSETVEGEEKPAEVLKKDSYREPVE